MNFKLVIGNCLKIENYKIRIFYVTNHPYIYNHPWHSRIRS